MICRRGAGRKTMMAAEKRLFVSHAGDLKWETALNENRILDQEPGETQIEKGIILPLKRREDVEQTTDGIFAGGVCTETFEFVSGLQRDLNKDGINLSCCRSYRVPEEELEIRHETVVFGGVLHWHFGNMLVNSTTRLWWYTEHQDTPYKFVFIHDEDKEPCYYEEFLGLLGLTADKIEIIQKPVQFDRIIVPDEACYIISGAHPKWLQVFDLMKEHVRQLLPPSGLKKIYLSRTQFRRDNYPDEFNEEYYEKFFAKRGFSVIHPETLPLQEQINMIMNAEEIVCTLGTLSNMAVYAEKGTKLVSIARRSAVLLHQLVINTLKDLDWYWVEGTRNPLPIPHDHGIALFYPTKHFKAFLDASGEPYEEREVPIETPPASMLMAYLETWTRRFASKEDYWRVKDKSAFEFVDSLSNVFSGDELDRGQYPETKKEKRIKSQKERIESLKEENRKRKEENKKLNKEVKRLLKEINSMKESKSWKITAPLRYLSKHLLK